MTDYGAVRLCDERDCKFSRSSQGPDNVLFGVTCVWRIQERGGRDRLDGLRVT